MCIYKNIFLGRIEDTILAYLIEKKSEKSTFWIKEHTFDPQISDRGTFFVEAIQHTGNDFLGYDEKPFSIFYEDFKIYRRKIEIYKATYEANTIEEMLYSEKQLKKLCNLRVKKNAEIYMRSKNGLRNDVIDNEDFYKDIDVPERIKEYSTRELLDMLRSSRTPGYYYWGTPEFTYEVLKKELSTREHVDTSKNQSQITRRRLARINYGLSKSKDR